VNDDAIAQKDKFDRSVFKLNGYIPRIAIMGGTFDPVHYGHMVAAEAVRQEFGVDEVRFIPAHSPPHKEAGGRADPWHRYMMTALATADNRAFFPSMIEIERGGKSYAVDTVRALRRELGGDAKIYFITGADAVLEILTWKEPDALLSVCDFVAVTRPGYKRETLLAFIEKLGKDSGGKIHFLEVPALAISSSDIRARVFLGKSAKYLMPDRVLDYIEKHGLYAMPRDSAARRSAEAVLEYLRANISGERLAHTMGVAEQSVRLAQVHGEDIELAYLAALLHDCAKELPGGEISRLAVQGGAVLDELTAAFPVLLHGDAAAQLAPAMFGIDDPRVLAAVRSHTIGRPGMSALEKILFIADTLDTGRDAEAGDTHRDRRAKIRDLAFSQRNLDAAVYETLALKRDHTLGKGAKMHPLADTALEHYRPVSL